MCLYLHRSYKKYKDTIIFCIKQVHGKFAILTWKIILADEYFFLNQSEMRHSL